MPNLHPTSTYYYKVGDPTKPNGVSPVFRFKVRVSFRKGCRGEYAPIVECGLGQSGSACTASVLAGRMTQRISCLQVPCAGQVYTFRLGCIADVGQTFNSTTTLARLQARSFRAQPVPAPPAAEDAPHLLTCQPQASMLTFLLVSLLHIYGSSIPSNHGHRDHDWNLVRTVDESTVSDTWYLNLFQLSVPQADKPDAVLLAGDLTYADDYNGDDRFGFQPRWDIWGRLSQALFATVPLITGIGASVLCVNYICDLTPFLPLAANKVHTEKALTKTPGRP